MPIISKKEWIIDIRNEVHHNLEEQGFAPYCITCQIPFVVKARNDNGHRFWSCRNSEKCGVSGRIEESTKGFIDELYSILGWNGVNSALFNNH